MNSYDNNAVAAAYHQYTRFDASGHTAVFEVLGNITGKKVLELGCGEGKFARLLASKGAQVEGADISEPMLKIAREASSEKIVFHLIKNAKLPPGRTYDAITTVFTLCNMESFSDVQSNLAACHKALKAGGKLVILESDFLRSAGKDFPTFSVDEKPPLREDQRLTLQLKIPPMSSLTVFNWHRTAERYAQALEKAGFRNTQVKRIGDSFPQTPYMVIWAEK